MGGHSYFLPKTGKNVFLGQKYLFYFLKGSGRSLVALTELRPSKVICSSFDEVWSQKPNFDLLKSSDFILKQKTQNIVKKTPKYPKNRM
jgi:hypothetical protein